MAKQKWDPLFPDVAEPAPGGVPDEFDESGAEPWHDAPASSHLEQFRYWDARKHSFLRRFLGGRSELQVRYRASKTQPPAQYTYFFTDHEQGLRIFELMKAADSPGTIEAAEIRGKVPYRKDAVSASDK